MPEPSSDLTQREAEAAPVALLGRAVGASAYLAVKDFASSCCALGSLVTETRIKADAFVKTENNR